MDEPPALSFRPLSAADYPRLLAWLQKAHVRQWWDDGDDTLEKVAAHYDPQPDEEGTARFILIEQHGTEQIPLGYFQYYFAGDEIGIDQFIGEESRLNQGLGQQAIRLFVELIVQHHHPAGIILDPHPDNRRAICCYERVGFEHVETVTDAEGKRVYWMRLGCEDS